VHKATTHGYASNRRTRRLSIERECDGQSHLSRPGSGIRRLYFPHLLHFLPLLFRYISNRHSSETLKLHYIRAIALQLCNQSAQRSADFLKAQSFALVQALCREPSRNQSFPQQTELRPSNPSMRRHSRKSASIVYSFLRRGLPESRLFLLRATSKRFASAL
jgi:hypothetical protein